MSGVAAKITRVIFALLAVPSSPMHFPSRQSTAPSWSTTLVNFQAGALRQAGALISAPIQAVPRQAGALLSVPMQAARLPVRTLSWSVKTALPPVRWTVKTTAHVANVVFAPVRWSVHTALGPARWVHGRLWGGVEDAGRSQGSGADPMKLFEQ
eukprot:450629-Prymnesium_polylepis.1